MTKKGKKGNNVIATHIVKTHVSHAEEKSDDSMNHTLTAAYSYNALQ
jgi:hypothetical protein